MMNKPSKSMSFVAAAGATFALAFVAVAQDSGLTSKGTEIGEIEAPEGPNIPESITLTGIARDFRERSEPNGHPDFERRPASGFGHYMNNVASELDEEFKPVFTGEGRKVSRQWKDAQGRPIHPALYDASLGDSAGSWGSYDPGGINSASSFAQWFRDVPGVNASRQLDITLHRQGDSNVYVFDDRYDPEYTSKGGFFPLNSEMFGNSANSSKNFHFTYELQTEFVYESNSGQVFTFNGDDDVWVFIDGQCVIDIGGVHGRTVQTVDLDRLDWLEDGHVYRLSFFFAERHRSQSNFRVETTLELRPAKLPTVAGMAD